MKRRYYFDVLPARLRPQKLESLSSYMIRVAEANNIQSISALSALFFDRSTTMRQLVDLADYPPISFENMPVVTGCPESKLWKMTFLHLGRKFGRSIPRLRNDKFLVGSIAPHLRFCPECLSRSPYYSLTWRFSALLGCARHRCRLLERCHHCGNKLSLLSPPLKMQMCSYCKNDLRMCPSLPLTSEEFRTTRRYMEDLEFLLSPHICEDDETLTRKVGYYYLNQRTPKVITTRMIAHHMGIIPPRKNSADQGTAKRGRRGTKLLNYQKYVDEIGSTMRHLFL